jgi:hypothetical protein
MKNIQAMIDILQQRAEKILNKTAYIFLYHYTNQENISVGTSIANWSKKETKDLIGLFVDTLVLWPYKFKHMIYFLDKIIFILNQSPLVVRP